MKFIRQIFRRFPLVANCISYGGLYTLGELSHQGLTKIVFAKKREEFDFAALGRMGLVGTFVSSPILYAWYKQMDQKLPGRTTSLVIKKVLMDQFIMTPFLLCCFFIAMAKLEQQEDLFAELKEKFVMTFARSCGFWLPATTINFLFIQPQYRVIYVAVCSFFWLNILAYIKHSKINVEKSIDKNDN